jgi:hypothetical protein
MVFSGLVGGNPTVVKDGDIRHGALSRHDEALRNDVEKRWHDPAGAHAAKWYVVCVIGVAAIAFVATVVWHSMMAAVLVPITLFVGGVGALVKTYLTWRADGTWPIWQGAGWILLLLMLLCLGVPVAVR